MMAIVLAATIGFWLGTWMSRVERRDTLENLLRLNTELHEEAERHAARARGNGPHGDPINHHGRTK